MVSVPVFLVGWLCGTGCYCSGTYTGIPNLDILGTIKLSWCQGLQCTNMVFVLSKQCHVQFIKVSMLTLWSHDLTWDHTHCSCWVSWLILASIIWLFCPSGDMKPFVLVAYKFDGVPEHTVLSDLMAMLKGTKVLTLGVYGTDMQYQWAHLHTHA